MTLQSVSRAFVPALSLALAQAAFAVGGVYAALPAGSISIAKNGTTYYLNGNTWLQSSCGANGVYYRVVPAP